MKTLKQLVEAAEKNHTYSVISHDVASREDDIPWHPTNYKVHGHKMDKASAHKLAQDARQERAGRYLKSKHSGNITGHKEGNSYHIINYDQENGEDGGVVHSVHVVKD